MTCNCIQITKKQAFLGRIARVVAVGKSSACMEKAIRHAFDTATFIEALVSSDHADSELMRLCAAPPGTYVSISATLRSLLLLANDIAYHTDGLFDVVAAGTDGRARWTDIDLSLNGYVLLRKRLRLSLGGLLKGFIVDAMAKVLAESGVGAGLVDLGGCIRAYGGSEWRIEFSRSILWSPSAGNKACHDTDSTIPIPLIDGALAGFGGYFGAGRLVDLRCHMVISPQEWGTRNILVRAKSCAVADALTKIVALQPEECQQLMTVFGADTAVLAPADTSVESQFYR